MEAFKSRKFFYWNKFCIWEEALIAAIRGFSPQRTCAMQTQRDVFPLVITPVTVIMAVKLIT